MQSVAKSIRGRESGYYIQLFFDSGSLNRVCEAFLLYGCGIELLFAWYAGTKVSWSQAWPFIRSSTSK